MKKNFKQQHLKVSLNYASVLNELEKLQKENKILNEKSKKGEKIMFVTKKKYKELEKNHFILQKAFLELKEEMMKTKKKVKKNDKSKSKN